MSTKIKRIQVDGIRGLLSFDLTLDSKSLVVSGENGSGKSSLVDALEFFFTGKVANLEGKQGISFVRHGCHISKSPNDAAVTVCFDPGSIDLTRTLATRTTAPPNLVAYLEAARGYNYTLRRSQVLQFIDSQPAERFRAIGSIIGIESLDKLELDFMRARDRFKAELDSHLITLKKALEKVGIATGKVPSDSNDCLDSLNTFLVTQKVLKVVSMQEARQLSEKLLAGVKKTESASMLRSLKALSDFDDLTSSSKEIQVIANEVFRISHSLRSTNASRSLSLATLLTEGERTIQSEGLTQCPLCESVIDTEPVLSSIRTRLQTLQALSNEASTLRKSADLLVLRINSLLGKLEQAQHDVRNVPALFEYEAKLSDLANRFQSLTQISDSVKELGSEYPSGELKKCLEILAEVIAILAKSAAEIIDAIEPSEEDKRILAIDRVVSEVSESMTTASTTEKALDLSNREFELASATYEAFTTAKKEEIQSIYGSIQADIERFYSRLHPGEEHKNIQLAVSPNKRASTELTIDSFGKTSEDPRALCSEGHLDSLGLCIFLAFVKRFNTDFPLMILDDVVTTVDAGHRERVCEILFEEFSDYQLLITTHDRIWSRQLRYQQQRYGLQSDFLNVEFVNWSVGQGVTVMPLRPRIEDIDEKIKKGDLSSAGNASRQYVEWLLFEICFRIRARLPIPFTLTLQFEAEELFATAGGRLKKLLREPTILESFEKAFQRLGATKAWGNLLSHHNIMAEELGTAEVRSFVDSVTVIHVLFSCKGCGNLLEYDQDMQEIICKSKKCSNRTIYKTK